MGADGNNIRIHQAYIDWALPDIPLKTRMGLSYFEFPWKAGGPAIFGTQAAAIISAFELNDNFSITGLWTRPFNDNFTGYDHDSKTDYHQNYLDNMDLFGLIFTWQKNGVEIQPWAVYGINGRNTLWGRDNGNWRLENFGTDGVVNYTMFPYPAIMNRNQGDRFSPFSTSKTYGSLFWTGLPIGITVFEPWNIEFDFNYGFVEAMGRFDTYKGPVTKENLKRASSERQGWLAKALVEYKFDWGAPGIFGWYASGDDGNPKNGSERMPSVCPYGDFTSFLGDGGATLSPWRDNGAMDYSGTWGLGIQVSDIVFGELPKFKQTLRAVWWGGTNSPAMVKYMQEASSWNDGWGKLSGPYLTTNDGLLELNYLNSYKIYENLSIEGQIGYIANFIDNDTWKKAGDRNSSFQKQDAWKFQLTFHYRF